MSQTEGYERRGPSPEWSWQWASALEVSAEARLVRLEAKLRAMAEAGVILPTHESWQQLTLALAHKDCNCPDPPYPGGGGGFGGPTAGGGAGGGGAAGGGSWGGGPGDGGGLGGLSGGVSSLMIVYRRPRPGGPCS
jgi:hypothetical protein